MTDYISREAAYSLAKKVCKAVDSNPRVLLPKIILDLIDDLPAADVRPVVLCKDCKCYQQSHYIDNHMECVRSGFPVHSVDFCSRGEKMEES